MLIYNNISAGQLFRNLKNCKTNFSLKDQFINFKNSCYCSLMLKSKILTKFDPYWKLAPLIGTILDKNESFEYSPSIIIMLF